MTAGKLKRKVPTRWLSMRDAIERILTIRQELKEFLKDKCKDIRAKRAYDFLCSYTSTSYCYFLKYALELFTTTNQVLQTAEPMIHKTRRILLDLYKSVLLQFMKKSAFTGKLVTEVDVDLSYNQLDVKDINIGYDTEKFMQEKNMDVEKIKKIKVAAKSFYKTAAKYIRDKLPLEDKVLQNGEAFDISRLQYSSFDSLRYFVERFDALKPKCSMDNLRKQWDSLCIEELPSEILNLQRADAQWGKVAELKGTTGERKYKDVASLALSVLCIPHSNAQCERVFSNVRKIRTDFRASMKADTLEAICIMKMHMQERKTQCYKQVYSIEETNQAKKSTMQYLAKCD